MIGHPGQFAVRVESHTSQKSRHVGIANAQLRRLTPLAAGAASAVTLPAREVRR